MIKVVLVQEESNVWLEYDSLEAVEELIRVAGSGQEIEDLKIFIALAKPKEEED